MASILLRNYNQYRRLTLRPRGVAVAPHHGWGDHLLKKVVSLNTDSDQAARTLFAIPPTWYSAFNESRSLQLRPGRQYCRLLIQYRRLALRPRGVAVAPHHGWGD